MLALTTPSGRETTDSVFFENHNSFLSYKT